MTGFAIAAAAGFKRSEWIVVGALAGHGVFDALHGEILEDAGVPVWWPASVSPTISAPQPALPVS
jgi:hypothetical protein